ncbi:MAG: DUF1707 SHOCT-like domain-containing protein, partial [Streptosporangiaceae bacterium]
GSMRAATADKERALDMLKAAFAEGRLTADEPEARAGQACTSRTYTDLAAVTGDLPAGPVGVMAPAGRPAGAGHLVTPASPRTSTLAICALICALLPGIAPLAAIPLGLAARRQIRTARQKDRRHRHGGGHDRRAAASGVRPARGHRHRAHLTASVVIGPAPCPGMPRSASATAPAG